MALYSKIIKNTASLREDKTAYMYLNSPRNKRVSWKVYSWFLFWTCSLCEDIWKYVPRLNTLIEGHLWFSGDIVHVSIRRSRVWSKVPLPTHTEVPLSKILDPELPLVAVLSECECAVKGWMWHEMYVSVWWGENIHSNHRSGLNVTLRGKIKQALNNSASAFKVYRLMVWLKLLREHKRDSIEPKTKHIS